MSELDIELLAETVESMVTRQLKEMANLCDSHGVPFATSVILSVSSELAGAALAMARDDNVRKGGLLMLSVVAKKAMDKYNADYAAAEAIDKAKAL